MNKKISFPIAIIIIAVLAILVGGIAIWQYLRMQTGTESLEIRISTDQIANWKTYQNKQYGFAIKYPTNWNYTEIIKPKGAGVGNGVTELMVNFSDSLDEKNTKQSLFFEIADISKKENEWQLADQIQLVKRDPYEKITIGNNEGYKKIVNCEDCPGFEKGRTYGYFYITDVKYLYKIEYIAEPNAINSEIIFNKIISTFKFIKSVYNTYKNEKYGYKINVLPGWEVWNSSGFERKTIAEKDQSGRGDYVLEISAEGLNQNITENNLLNWLRDNYKSDYYYYPPDWTSINGYPGYKTYAYAAIGGGIPTIDTFILAKGIVYHFSCLINVEKYPTDHPISDSSGECDEMIKSFKIN